MNKERIKSLLSEIARELDSEDGKELKNKEPDENKVRISELNPGDVFKTGIGDFIVLGEQDGGIAVITKELYGENVKYDNDSPDYKKSSIKKLIEGDILADFEKEFGSENILKTNVRIKSVDMQDYPGFERKVGLLTFEETRKYNDLLVNKELPDWWWTCTPWSTSDRGFGKLGPVVSPSGRVNRDNCNGDYGCRPFCILKSDIFVSCEE